MLLMLEMEKHEETPFFRGFEVVSHDQMRAGYREWPLA